jgi:hypothetical protein
MINNLHAFLDIDYGPGGDGFLSEALQKGAKPELPYGNFSETMATAN